MISENFTFKDKENVNIFVYKWSPEKISNIKGIVQISHGMAETAARYERFANAMVNAGFIVYANDHRGHGKTAKVLENLGYLADKDGYNLLVEDMHQLTEIIKNENKEIPIILFGHSMGSFLTQRYISLYGDELKGAILSGTNGDQGFSLTIGLFIARLVILNKGRKSKSELLNKMSLGAYNNAFKPSRTDFDWLSKDNAEVDKYIKDPFCGSVFTAGFFYDFFSGLKETYKLENIMRIPKELPIYIFSGEKDPVGNNTKGVMKLIENYKKIGLKNIKYKFYKDGRHEMLNEINREEVTEDIINWTNSVVGESVIYDGWIKLFKKKVNGKEYEIIKNYDAVAAVIFNEKKDILLVKQFRPVLMKETLEIPAGVMDIIGETKEECILRELKEETGLDILAENIEKIVSYRPQMGFSASSISIFKVEIKASDIKSSIVNDTDVTSVQWASLDELKSRIENDEITDGKTIMSYYYLKSKQVL